MGSVRLSIDIDKACLLRRQYDLKAFIETGTFKLGSTLLAQPFFERIITIEGYEPRFRKNMAQMNANGSKPANVEFVLGDSRVELARALDAVDTPALLWLDAHWNGGGAPESHALGDECPLREELQAVLASKHADQHVLMIDDARLFLSPPPYPHDPAQWMTYAEIEQMLAPRVLYVLDDVIYGEPAP